jgi:hypothetical protein
MKPGGKAKAKGKAPVAKIRYTQGQLGFLQWAYQQGVQNKADKLSPHGAARLMELHGTHAGEVNFPNDAYWKVGSARQGKASFRLSELLDHWTFRPWFSQQKAAFDKKVAAAGRTAPTSIADVSVEESSDDGEDFQS